MLNATFTMTDEELRKSIQELDKMDTREKRVPWLLKLFMGKGRPRYSWQVWLSNHWPTKEIPKERQLTTIMNNEITREIDNELLRELMKQITQDKQ